MAHEAVSRKSVVSSPRLLRTGAYMGLLAGGAVMFFLPWLLSTQFSLKVAPAWGLGDVAFAFCAAGALAGMLIGWRIKL